MLAHLDSSNEVNSSSRVRCVEAGLPSFFRSLSIVLMGLPMSPIGLLSWRRLDSSAAILQHCSSRVRSGCGRLCGAGHLSHGARSGP